MGTQYYHPDLKVKKVNESEEQDLNKAFAAGYDIAPTAAQVGIKTQGGFAHHPDTIADLEETGGSGEWGTTPQAKKYKKDTPGEK